MARSKVWKSAEKEIGRWYSHYADHERNPLSGRSGLLPGDVPTTDFVIEVKYRQNQPVLDRFDEFVTSRLRGDYGYVLIPKSRKLDYGMVLFAPTLMALHKKEIARALKIGRREGLLSELRWRADVEPRLELVRRGMPKLNAETSKWWKATCVDADRLKVQPILFLREAGDTASTLAILKKEYLTKLATTYTSAEVRR